MEKEKMSMIDEIKRIDRELYLKRSKLASVEAMEYGAKGPAGNGMDVEDWKRAISELVRLIGTHSTGGDSVEDVREERRG